MCRSTSSTPVRFAIPIVVAIVVASCTGSSGVTTESADSISDNPAPADTSPSPSDPPPAANEPPSTVSSLDWAPCDDVANLDCATLTVPLDHAAPDGATIDIAVARSTATGRSDQFIGSLVFNPGGPGASGIEALEFLSLTMSDQVTGRFDLVSFDPRGVGASTAVECTNGIDDNIDLLADGDDAAWEALVAERYEQIATCTAESLDIAPYLGTNNAARDMDLLRAALGDDDLTYVGYSYGTRLGATYAELFPDKVRALVLDAAAKPTSDTAALDREQGAGFDRALENFAAACDADADCVLREVGPTLDVIVGLENEIAEVGSFPTDDPSRVLTPGELHLGIAAALYSKDSWTFLASALYAAETSQDGTLLQVLGDSLVGRQPDGSYDNSNVANSFILCADDPARRTSDEQQVVADEAADLSTYFADFLRGSTGCLGIDDAIDPLVIGPADGAAPIVVIGNTGDPATPYAWSVELAASLSTAVLYTVEAEGHTAYGTIDCVQAEIDAYLIDLEMPAADATCSDNASADFFVPDGESEIDQVVAFFDCLRDEGVPLPAISEADILSDPTLEAILGELDFGAPVTIAAVGACQRLLPV